MKTSGYLMSLRIIFAAFICGILAFALIVYFMLKPTQLSPTPKLLIFVLPIIIAIGLLISETLSFKKCIEARGKDLKTKLAAYQTAMIIKATALEIPALIAIILALILENRYWLWFAAFPIFWLFYRFPNQSDLIKKLDLNFDDIQQLEKKN